MAAQKQNREPQKEQQRDGAREAWWLLSVFTFIISLVSSASREIRPEHQPGKCSAPAWSCQVPVTKPLPQVPPDSRASTPRCLARFGQRRALARTGPSWPGSVPAAATSQVVRHSGLPCWPGTRWVCPRVQPESSRTSGQGGEAGTHPSVSLATHLSSHWVAGFGFTTDSLPGPGSGLSPQRQGRELLTSGRPDLHQRPLRVPG